MSQSGAYLKGGGSGIPIETITGNTGGAVGPSASDNINLIGSGSISVAGNPGTNTLTISSSGSSSITITGDTGGALTSSSFTFTGGTTGLTFNGSGTTETVSGTLIVGNGGTGATTLTSNGVLLGNTTSAITATAAGTTGQVLTGVTGSAPTFQSPAASSITITGDTGGGLTGNSFTFTGGTTGLSFGGSGTTETLTIGNLNLPTTSSTVGQITIGGTRTLHSYGTGNIFVGPGSGNTTLTTGTAQFNTGIGDIALPALTSGTLNTALGVEAGHKVSSGGNNTLLGSQAGLNFTTGSFNTLIGLSAGQNYTTSESSNIIVGPGVAGTVGESNVIRIGTQGSSSEQQNKCFIAGITGVTITGNPVLCSSVGALGTVTAGTNGQVFLGSTGASPAFGTLTSSASSLTYTTGAASLNIDVNNWVAATALTPGISFGGGTTGITYSFQQGQYTRIGNLIFYHIYITLSSKGSSTGTALVTGLPVTVGTSGMAPTIFSQNLTFVGNLCASVNPAATTISLLSFGTATTTTILTDTAFANNTNLVITGYYSTV